MKLKLSQMLQMLRETIQDQVYSANSQTLLITDEQAIQFLNEGLILACQNSALLKTNDPSVGEETTSIKFNVFNANLSTINFINWGDDIILNEPVSFTSNTFITANNIANKINTYQKTKDIDKRFIAKVLRDEFDDVSIIINAPKGSGSMMNDIYPTYENFPSNSILIDFDSIENGHYGICKLMYEKGDDILYYSDRIIRFLRYENEKKQQLCISHVNSCCGDILYGESNDFLRLKNKPKKDGYIIATVEYLPKPLIKPDDIPEIKEQYHPYLINYAVYKTLLITDIEAEQVTLGNRHLNIFNEQFGFGRNTAINLSSEAFRYGDYNQC